MISADMMRKDLGISDDMTLKDIFMDYFQKKLQKIKNDYNERKTKESQYYYTIPVGIIDLEIDNVLGSYGIEIADIPKFILDKEIDKFVEKLNELGFKIRIERMKGFKYINQVSVCWLKQYGFNTK